MYKQEHQFPATSAVTDSNQADNQQKKTTILSTEQSKKGYHAMQTPHLLRTISLLTIIAILGVVVSAQAATETWTGAASANWSGANWTGGDGTLDDGDAMVFVHAAVLAVMQGVFDAPVPAD